MSAAIERLQATIAERYAVEREIGRGGMAIVYLARDLKHDRPVALKVLHPDFAMMLGAERFRREIQLTTQLSHPHILPIYDSGEADESLFYAMPYVAGESLRARLDRERQLPVDEAVEIACQVAAALDHAHRQGIVHRDIKPENILLEDGQAIVADFGIAHLMSAAGEERLTQTGMSLGTPSYMSPEQATAERSLDGRSDIYGLACVTYEMLAGQPPFTGPTMQAIIARHTLEPVPSLAIVRGAVPPHVEGAIRRALEKVPADRFRSAADFAAALRDPAAGGTGSGLRWVTQQPLGARAAGRTRRIAIGAGALVALLGLGVVGWQRWHRGSPHGTMVDGPDPRRIAVLYFADGTPGGSLGYLADGLTDELIDRLSAVRQLDVLSRNAASVYRHTEVPRDSIARALKAGTLVDGSVEQSGDRISVSVRLRDASGTDFRTTTFHMAAGNVLGMRDTLAARVAQFLRQRLGEEIRLREERQEARDPNAWALLQRARLRMRAADDAKLANDTAEMLRELEGADSMLVSAVRLDPRWAAPATLRGSIAYGISYFLRGNPRQASPWIDRGLARAGEALAVAPKDADALELRGTLRYLRWLLALEQDPAKADSLLAAARQDLEAATAASPAQPGAWSVLSHLYYQVNDVVSAKGAARRAYEEDAYLSNADVILWRLFASTYDLEQFTEAVQWCDEGARRFPADPHFVECRLHLMAANAVPPDVALAKRLADSLVAVTLAPQRPYKRLEAQVLVAAAMARAGQADSAKRLLERTAVPADLDPTLDLTLSKGVVWNLLGDTDRALDALSRYIRANPARASGLSDDNNWMWRNLRSDPRFLALVRDSKQ